MQALARKALGRRATSHVHTVSEGSDVCPKTGQGYHAEAEAGFNEISIWYGDPRVAKLALEAALQAIVDDKEKRKKA